LSKVVAFAAGPTTAKNKHNKPCKNGCDHHSNTLSVGTSMAHSTFQIRFIMFSIHDRSGGRAMGFSSELHEVSKTLTQ
jgi:hypothetical protein